jgi:NADH-ubiquinone oxidoreductase chain 5
LNSFFIYWLGVVAAFITSFYSIRLVYLVFFAKSNSFSRSVSSSHESSSFIFYVLTFLGFLSIFIGFVFRDLFVGLGTDFWANSIFNLYNNSDILYAEFLEYYYKLIPLFFSIFGLLTSISIYFVLYNYTIIIVKNGLLRSFYFFLVKKWYFDLVYNNLFVFKLLTFFYLTTFKVIDRGLIEFFGPLSIVRLINHFSSLFSFFQTGFLYNYIFIVLLGIIFFLKLTLSLIFVDVSFIFNFGLFICLLTSLIFINFHKQKDI